VDFPGSWLPSLVRAFEEAVESGTRIVVRMPGGSLMRGYASSSPAGAPAVARVLYEGKLYDFRDLDGAPESIEDAGKTRGRTVVRWSMERDEPVMWVMET